MIDRTRVGLVVTAFAGAFLLTAPVSAHMIGRAAYSDGVALCDETEVDELRSLYEQTDAA